MNRGRRDYTKPKNLLGEPSDFISKVQQIKESLRSLNAKKHIDGTFLKTVREPKIFRVTSSGLGLKRALAKPTRTQMVFSKKSVLTEEKAYRGDISDLVDELDKGTVLKREPTFVDMSLVKTEPIDYSDTPDLSVLTKDTYETPQNIIIKEEYEINERSRDLETNFEANSNEEETQKSIISSFSSQNDLVIKETIKRKMETKDLKANRRKTMALSFPQDANLVENIVIQENESRNSRDGSAILSNVTHFIKFKCEHCTVTSRSRALVIKHIKEAHAFRCTVCLEVFSNAHKLAYHVKNQHNIELSDDGGRRKQNLKANTPAGFRLRSNSLQVKK